MPKKLWGGRFKKGMDPTLKCFSYSLSTDKELLCAELCVNEAWIRMLRRAKLLTAKESQSLLRGLKSFAKSLTKKTDFSAEARQYEDVHSYVQQSLEKKAGKVGKKLHTGRSRNDLVVTSTRFYLKSKVSVIAKAITHTQKALVNLARKAGALPVAGMTHLQLAQPILMAHHLLAYVEMLEEDKARLLDAKKRIDIMPLGAAALAGSSLEIDQRFLARELKFAKISTNSMAAVSDRAFITEFVSALSILWMHLSRLSEDFILWNSETFDYLELDDAFATGSSLMPQKKNPDVFELIRGRSGVIFGHLNALLTLQKGLPLAYNRDLQEDKPGLFDAIRKTEGALEVLTGTLSTTSFRADALAISVVEDTLYATDLLEYLVRKGVAFSEAHETIGKVVAYGAQKGISLSEISLSAWKHFSPTFEKDIYRLFQPQRSMQAKRTIGSTHPSRVAGEIKRWKKVLK